MDLQFPTPTAIEIRGNVKSTTLAATKPHVWQFARQIPPRLCYLRVCDAIPATEDPSNAPLARPRPLGRGVLCRLRRNGDTSRRGRRGDDPGIRRFDDVPQLDRVRLVQHLSQGS